MKRLIPATLLLVVALTGCGGTDDDAASASTTEPPAAADAPTTTPVAPTTLPTTTEAASTTTVKPSLVSAVVWQSAVDASRVNQPDPIPTQSVNGVTVRLQLAMYGPLKGAGKFSSDCAEEYEAELSTDCLLVQLSMDVASDFRVDGNSPEASMGVDAAITPEGKQIESIWVATGYPGTRDVGLVVMMPGATPGSMVKVSVGSNLVGYEILTFVLPSQFLPVDWAG